MKQSYHHVCMFQWNIRIQGTMLLLNSISFTISRSQINTDIKIVLLLWVLCRCNLSNILESVRFPMFLLNYWHAGFSIHNNTKNLVIFISTIVKNTRVYKTDHSLFDEMNNKICFKKMKTLCGEWCLFLKENWSIVWQLLFGSARVERSDDLVGYKANLRLHQLSLHILGVRRVGVQEVNIPILKL